MQPELAKLIIGFESFIHLGDYADTSTVIGYMQHCHWLIIPSRMESIPLILVDAIQMRLPCIVTEVGDMGKIVRRFGLGRVIPAAEPAMLAEAIQQVLDTERAPSTGAWHEANQLFDLNLSAAICVENLEKCLLRKSKK